MAGGKGARGRSRGKVRIRGGRGRGNSRGRLNDIITEPGTSSFEEMENEERPASPKRTQPSRRAAFRSSSIDEEFDQRSIDSKMEDLHPDLESKHVELGSEDTIPFKKPKLEHDHLNRLSAFDAETTSCKLPALKISLLKIAETLNTPPTSGEENIDEPESLAFKSRLQPDKDEQHQHQRKKIHSRNSRSSLLGDLMPSPSDGYDEEDTLEDAVGEDVYDPNDEADEEDRVSKIDNTSVPENDSPS
eukprot:CAMPEP_0194284638 /NCGR_PEP_ID=MMETSP0169-20130528/28161_1 /TAXON_ID=218684 /ORGANISM="Corethron pennatum, Strain L29A3" /LENGTH=245 /DNA_ID=CAMNT_0039030517 /DNA_START=61 /DNA_END=794 /DNA_ORIENTATION=-